MTAEQRETASNAKPLLPGTGEPCEAIDERPKGFFGFRASDFLPPSLRFVATSGYLGVWVFRHLSVWVLRDDVMHDVAVDVRQPVVASLMAIG